MPTVPHYFQLNYVKSIYIYTVDRRLKVGNPIIWKGNTP